MVPSNEGEEATLGNSGDLKERVVPEWIQEKIVQCGKVVGVSVDSCQGGWDDVIRIAANREKLNRAELTSAKSRKQGMRELQKLPSSINYEKLKVGKQNQESVSRAKRKGKGVIAADQ